MGLGFQRIATGVLMMQIAKLLGQGILCGRCINTGFDSLTRWSGTDVWCLAIGYGLQLFFDFAGYSHIAIGAAKVLGFTVPENFARPFQSTNGFGLLDPLAHVAVVLDSRLRFLPLAVLRREVVAEPGAGRLDGGVRPVAQSDVLFVLWGCYHGVLLVFHRQVQQVQRRFDWEPAAYLWEPALVGHDHGPGQPGMDSFRPETLAQAAAMFSAVLTPAAIHAFSERKSLLAGGGCAAGYVVVLTSDALERHIKRANPDETQARRSSAAWRGSVGSGFRPLRTDAAGHTHGDLDSGNERRSTGLSQVLELQPIESRTQLNQGITGSGRPSGVNTGKPSQGWDSFSSSAPAC